MRLTGKRMRAINHSLNYLPLQSHTPLAEAVSLPKSLNMRNLCRVFTQSRLLLLTDRWRPTPNRFLFVVGLVGFSKTSTTTNFRAHLTTHNQFSIVTINSSDLWLYKHNHLSVTAILYSGKHMQDHDDFRQEAEIAAWEFERSGRKFDSPEHRNRYIAKVTKMKSIQFFQQSMNRSRLLRENINPESETNNHAIDALRYAVAYQLDNPTKGLYFIRWTI